MAFLVTADLAPGRIPLAELTRNATESGGGTVDEVIDACSQTAWHQDIWKRLKSRYMKPATCPTGEMAEILKTLTLYWIWSRWTASFGQTDDDKSPNQLKAAREELLAFLEDVANGVNGASIDGLTEVDVEEAGGGNQLISYDEDLPYYGTTGFPKF